MMKILVLEDNIRLCNAIKAALSKEDYKVDIFHDGKEALDALMNGYNCFILDINVPSIDGISILKDIRMSHEDIPVIIISSNYDLDNIQNSYEKGCNDYLKKPFYMYELVHKIKNLCHVKNEILQFTDGYTYHFKTHSLFCENKEINLSKKEILFLELLGSDTNKIFSFHDIEEYVWEGEETTLANIRALVKRVRKKIPNNFIKIVKGLGYSINTHSLI